MPIHGTTRAYEDINGLDKDRVNSYPPQRDGSKESSQAKNFEEESTNVNDLPFHGDEVGEATDEQSQRVRAQRNKGPLLKLCQIEKRKNIIEMTKRSLPL